MDRNLLFYRLRIPKESYQYLMGHKIIEEKGKYENGKQWVHLHKTNVKSRATLTTPDKREILMWTGELLSKDDMEALAWQIDPQWDYPAHYVKGARIVSSHMDESAPFDLSAHSAPAGICSDQRPTAKKVLPPPRVKPAPPTPKDPRVSSTPYRPEPSFPKQDASKASGPQPPPFPPPGWRAGAGAPSSLEPQEPPPRTNRWNKMVSKPSTNKILSKPTFGNTEDQGIQDDEDMASVKAGNAEDQGIQDDEDMASVKAETSAKAEIPVKEEDDGMASNPQHEEISRFPMPAQEEIIKHDDAVNYVKTIVREFLYGSVEDAQEKNPAYKRNALTNFLLMTLVSSFLDTVREAGRQMYLQLEGYRNDYYADKTWRQMDELNLKKWSAHGRSGWVWEYMESLGVENFTPHDPTDMGQWQDWLTQEQLIRTMEWLFESCWRSWANRWIEKENRMQLWDHVHVLWRYYRVVVTVHVKTTAGLQPDNFPSCWTWEGFLRSQRMKYVEKAVKAFRSKIGSAESLARMHAETFAFDVNAFVLGNDG
eukprot:symbB.v1.2.009121.t1/scaffold572.1/size185581/10